MHIKDRFDWDDLRVFLMVARVGSLTAASDQLGLVHTTISRRISSLERRLGARLFARHHRGMQLTQRGRELARQVAPMESAASEAEQRLLRGSSKEMAGTVRIAATDGMASVWLTPQLIAFHRAHPSIRVEVAVVNSWADLATEESDIVLRYARSLSSGTASRKVGRTHFALYAARSYLDAYGAPERVEDLKRHTLIENINFRTNQSLSEWQDVLSAAPVRLSSNAGTTVLASVRAGAGIAMLPTTFEMAAPELIVLDIPLKLTSDIWMTSHIRTNKTPRVRALIAYIAERFARDRARWFF
jgi:DNA-binding transcriptional LysR family regulator